ncbi:MAG: endonuclease III [Candidatus Hodarchaeaceae archaeon]|nr:endonuclease III [Candidatus Hodarchaeaceae archaeon]
MALKSVTIQAGAAGDLKDRQAGPRRMDMILNRLGAEFEPWRRYTDDPFLLLVGTVLSQNTNWRNTRAAYNRLTSRFRTPAQLANADVREIRELIRPAGLHREKSKRLREISRAVLEKYGGNLNSVLQKPVEEARRELLSLPGVGFKTADVVMAFGAGKDVIAVDTHVFRISKRLGLASHKDNHEQVKAKLESVTSAGRRRDAHMLLVELGRRYCRARNPLHQECPINDLCPIGVRHLKRTKFSPRAGARSTS